MNARAWELLAAPVRAARRAGLVWGVSLAALIVLTVAFYPAFRDQPELSNLVAGMPSALVDAFGLADFGTPAGFLRGNLYAVLVPLMLALAGVLLMNGQTAADEDTGRIDELAERFTLDLDRPIRQLSSGNRRKVSVLGAFLADADLLILDEPTGGLDPLMQHEFLQLVRERRAAGATVFLSSHILSEVQSIADRMVVLRAGSIVAAGTVSEVRGLARQRVEVWFDTAAPAGLAGLPGIGQSVIDGRRFTAVLTGSARPLIDALAGQPISSIQIQEPDLEEAFLGLYTESPDADAGEDPR